MFESPASGAPTRADDSAPDAIHLLDLAALLAAHKKLVFGLPLLTAAIALGASMLMPPSYSSTTKLMPPQQQSSGMAAMLGQLGGLAGAAGGLAGSLKNQSDLYVGLLESRTVADRLIARFKLRERYNKRTMDDTRKELAGVTAVVNSKKDGLITITASDEDPKFAADLANAYFEELTRLTQTMALSEAAQRRVFFENQLKDVKDKLADAEVRMRETQEKSGMIQPQAQVEAIITSVAKLKGTIVAKEVELNAMRTFATARNPDLMRGEEELRGLRIALSKLEKNQDGHAEGDFMVPTGRIPQTGLEYVRALRDVKYQETIFELMAKQFEMAKIDEAKEPNQVQLLDAAVPAERKSKPKPVLMTLAGLIGGGLLGILLAFLLASYRSSRADPASNARWQRLALAWNGRTR